MPSFYHLSTLATVALLTSCTVYAPTVPSTPLLEAKQVEITASLRGGTVPEVAAAWSPVPHLLLTGEAALQTSTTTATTNNVTTTYNDYHRQAGLGAGIYRAPTDRSPWYVAAVGGIGFAKTSLHAIDISAFLSPDFFGYYEANYWRGYAQVYAARPLTKRLMGGFSVRGTYVNYTHFAYEGQAMTPNNHFFVEPTLFLRLGRGPVRGLATVGLSVPTSREATQELTRRTAPVTGLFSIGVVVRPDLIGRHRRD